MEESKNKIIDNELHEDDEFSQCIEINNELLAASEERSEVISIWDINNYTKKMQIQLNTMTSDLLLLNSEYFISSQPYQKQIIFHSINNLEEKTIIKNIDSCDCKRCLSANKIYVLVKCKNGIAILSIKNKELIQYIQDFDESSKASCLRIDDNNHIYNLFYDNYNFGSNGYEIKFEISKFKGDKIEKRKTYEMIYESEHYSLNVEFFLNGNKYLLNVDENILSL